ncbi:MAG: F0F1 ATP synthase subunit delta [Pseudomonadota bacterium]
MTASRKVSSTVSKRYASALLDLAVEKKRLDQVAADLKALQGMIADSSMLFILIHSPLVSKAQKSNGLMAVTKKAGFDKLTENFLGVLIHNGRLSALGAIISAFDYAIAEQRGEITVNVEVAQDMSKEQQAELQKTISKAVGSDVTLKLKVEPGILGGMIVTVGSHMVDDSVARKLERLQAAMSKQSNVNEEKPKKKTKKKA